MLIIDDAESLTDALDDIEIQKEKILTPPCSHPTSASTPCRHFVFLSVNNSQSPQGRPQGRPSTRMPERSQVQGGVLGTAHHRQEAEGVGAQEEESISQDAKWTVLPSRSLLWNRSHEHPYHHNPCGAEHPCPSLDFTMTHCKTSMMNIHVLHDTSQ